MKIFLQVVADIQPTNECFALCRDFFNAQHLVPEPPIPPRCDCSRRSVRTP